MIIYINYIIIYMSPKKGDWICSQCSDLNFASRTNCWKCGIQKTINCNSNSSSNSLKLPEVGDWQCKICNNYEWNFKKRQQCRTCGADKKLSSIEPIIPATNIIDVNSECKICMDRPMNIVFSSCGHMSCCDVCCHAIDKCPICRVPYTENQIIKVFVA